MTDDDRTNLDRMLEELSEEPPQQDASATSQADYRSPTVAALDTSRRPDPAPVCEACPHSMWFASRANLKCHCRVMHAVTWTSEEPTPILSCDGILLGLE